MTRRWVSWAAVSTPQQVKKKDNDESDNAKRKREEREREVDKVSLPEQLASNRQHVDRHNGVLVTELIVPGISRSITLFEDACLRIPAYAQLRQLIADRALDVLVCYDRTRLGRKASLVMAVTELCAEAGVVIYETTSPPATLDLRRGMDDALIGAIKAVGAQQEVEKLRERTHIGRMGRARSGKPTGRLLYGYRYYYEPDGRRHIIIDEEQAEAVRLACTWYAHDGLSVRPIAVRLNAQGYRPAESATFDRGTIQHWIENRWTYAAKLTYRHYGEIVVETDGEWPPIITEELARQMDLAQALRTKARRAGTSDRPFSQVAFCGHCGRALLVHNSGRYPSYICRTGMGIQCPGSAVSERHLFRTVRNMIGALSDNAVLDSVVASLPTPPRDTKRQLTRAEESLAAIQAERDKLLSVYLRNVINTAEFERAMESLAERLHAAQHEVAHLTTVLAQIISPREYRRRVTSIRDEGLAVLAGDDMLAINRWLRAAHIQLYVAQDPYDPARTTPNRVARAVIAP